MHTKPTTVSFAAMRLAVVVNNIDKGAFSLYVQALVKQLAGNGEVLVISNTAIDEQECNNAHIQLQVIPSALSNAITRKFWYDVKLHAATKKFKADAVLFTTNFVSISIKVRQLLLLNNILPPTNTLAKATFIIANNQKQKVEIIDKTKIPEYKITVIHPFAPALYQPISFAEKQVVKDGYADGREFYLWIDDAQINNNAIEILKAFSQFKKRLLSNMKLVLAGMDIVKQKLISSKIASYKYREDVVLLDNPTNQQFATLLAAAYAVIHTPIKANSGLHQLQAMQCQVPIITTQWVEEITGNTAIYVTSPTVTELADAMIQLYKNETQRNELANHAAKQSALFSAPKTAIQILQLAQSATT